MMQILVNGGLGEGLKGRRALTTSKPLLPFRLPTRLPWLKDGALRLKRATNIRSIGSTLLHSNPFNPIAQGCGFIAPIIRRVGMQTCRLEWTELTWGQR